jgi:hypothetical protein
LENVSPPFVGRGEYQSDSHLGKNGVKEGGKKNEERRMIKGKSKSNRK